MMSIVLQPFIFQATTLDLQLATASTTIKANRANSELAALQTAGVAGTGVRPISTSNYELRGRYHRQHRQLVLPATEIAMPR
jgi:hypothetical protein